ncbi:uncharacterized protein E0L32_008985 [Thyridium curvatum]|uniref:Dihydrofolate reductase n=1 Tax=Thyridium curvatum TaxID=1093900 RepID=A0A507ATH8_9PEZI|nr:uncharacterized protein E0L32_008985 [Thyridium curvatum]TPX09794.1 hypothetical protein E0L32_008985 [Thyridium curvatum]
MPADAASSTSGSAGVQSTSMPPSPLELTLVVAATRDMGIGLRGTLPWTGLKKEMAYFARVTKRLPPTSAVRNASQKLRTHTETHIVDKQATQPSPAPAVNAVIMGRKTWDSIPPRFRPLKDRLNVVVSRSFASGGQQPQPQLHGSEEDPSAQQPLRAGSLEQALELLRARAASGAVARVFVIGGGQIYASSLKLAEARRVLLTRVLTDFECDTHFPLALREEGKDGDGPSEGGRWVRKSKEELDRWAGEEVAGGVQVENNAEYEFQMWERVD